MDICAPLTIEDVLDEVDKLNYTPALRIATNFGLLSTIHKRLEQRAKSAISLAQLNELFNSHASSLVELFHKELKGYINVRPLERDGEQDADLSWNGQITRAELLLQIRSRGYWRKWRTFLTLCCPIYESHLWDHAKLFDLPSDLPTLNSNLETSASSALEALCEAFPKILLVEDRGHEERLVFYPFNETPKLSRDYLHYLFFKTVHQEGEITFSALSREMKLRHRIDLDGETLRRIFRKNYTTPLDIIQYNPVTSKKNIKQNPTKDRFNLRVSPTNGDFVLSDRNESEDSCEEGPGYHLSKKQCEGDETELTDFSIVRQTSLGHYRIMSEEEICLELVPKSSSPIKSDLLAKIKQAGQVTYSILNDYCVKQYGIDMTGKNMRKLFPDIPANMALALMRLDIALLVGFERVVRVDLPKYGNDLVLACKHSDSSDSEFYQDLSERTDYSDLHGSTDSLTSGLPTPSATQLKEVLLAEITRRGSVTYSELFMHCQTVCGLKLSAKNLEKIFGSTGKLKDILRSILEGHVVFSDCANFTLTARNSALPQSNVNFDTQEPTPPSASVLAEKLLEKIGEEGTVSFEKLSQYCKTIYDFGLGKNTLAQLYNLSGATSEMMQALLGENVLITPTMYSFMLTIKKPGGTVKATSLSSPPQFPSASQLKEVILTEIRRRGSITYSELSKHCAATCGVELTTKNLQAVFACTGKTKEILSAMFEGQVEIDGAVNFMLTEKMAPDYASSFGEEDVGSTSSDYLYRDSERVSTKERDTHTGRSTVDTFVKFLEENGGIPVMASFSPQFQKT